MTNQEQQLLTELRGLGLELADNAIVYLDRMGMELGIMNESGNGFDFNSSFSVSAKVDNRIRQRNNELNLSSASHFDPSNRAKYWHTIHAAEVLKNWNAICSLVNRYCEGNRYFEA